MKLAESNEKLAESTEKLEVIKKSFEARIAESNLKLAESNEKLAESTEKLEVIKKSFEEQKIYTNEINHRVNIFGFKLGVESDANTKEKYK